MDCSSYSYCFHHCVEINFTTYLLVYLPLSQAIASDEETSIEKSKFNESCKYYSEMCCAYINAIVLYNSNHDNGIENTNQDTENLIWMKMVLDLMTI